MELRRGFQRKGLEDVWATRTMKGKRFHLIVRLKSLFWLPA